MSDRLTAGAGVLMASLSGLFGIARLWPIPTGRHRTPRIPGQLARQRFVHCPACRVETTATIHGSALLCAQGHTILGGTK
ncbi:hypothetical protein ACH5A7_21075 [Streptomyces sp. NPDC018955]|uniref:hypothetical protein n=1 Tax=Streptomyces sp. NPDC018955 TaxID=3365055 RepID=UPI00378CDE12